MKVSLSVKCKCIMQFNGVFRKKLYLHFSLSHYMLTRIVTTKRVCDKHLQVFSKCPPFGQIIRLCVIQVILDHPSGAGTVTKCYELIDHMKSS